MHSKLRTSLAALTALAAACSLASTALADSTPIGALPKGPVTTVAAERGSLVAVALPRDARGVWRLARRLDAKVLREVTEADVPGGTVVVVFRAGRPGTVRVVFALTRSDVSGKGLRSITHVVRVR